MSEPLCDPLLFEGTTPLHDLASVGERIPHRHEMALLHGVLHHDRDAQLAVGFHDAKPEDFWVRGHIPGRPIMPGVVLVEMAAQLCAWLSSFEMEAGEGEFFGFGGIREAKFRGQVGPTDRVVIASRIQRLRRKLATFGTQAWVGGDMVYEGQIIGVVL